jgi:hypothetical protein
MEMDIHVLEIIKRKCMLWLCLLGKEMEIRKRNVRR